MVEKNPTDLLEILETFPKNDSFQYNLGKQEIEDSSNLSLIHSFEVAWSIKLKFLIFILHLLTFIKTVLSVIMFITLKQSELTIFVVLLVFETFQYRKKNVVDAGTILIMLSYLGISQLIKLSTAAFYYSILKDANNGLINVRESENNLAIYKVYLACIFPLMVLELCQFILVFYIFSNFSKCKSTPDLTWEIKAKPRHCLLLTKFR